MKSPNVKRIYRTLPKLTPEQYRKVRKLTNRCCNKDRGNCLLLDHGEYVPCIQAHSLSVTSKPPYSLWKANWKQNCRPAPMISAARSAVPASVPNRQGQSIAEFVQGR